MRRGAPVEAEVVLRRGEGKRARLNGAPLRTPELLRNELPALVFTPDRLAVVKGGPAIRRAYLDRAVGRLLPARADLPLRYGEALGQRNACLRKISAGYSTAQTLAPWTEQVVSLGASLQVARAEVLAALSPSLTDTAAAFGLSDCRLEYRGEPLSADALEKRLPRDIERGTTGQGPHLDEIAILSGARDLRSFGSQGEQRTAVLALLLAEATLLVEMTGEPPLLLLDDVLSELDFDRRRMLTELLGKIGQTVITATSESALPLEPDQLVLVRPGTAEAQ